ncbi:MAG: diaminopimelate decarboxylase [Candidatus Eremiobacteraeota bacterium]|nr:diaminopimelate decarboxylase [Candidatus Eremiobacteraeota bacterium]
MTATRSALLQWHDGLAPGQTRREGEIFVGGCSAERLADIYGTPLLAIDYGVLDAAIDEFTAAARPLGVDIAYAGKALLLVGIAKHLLATPLQIDVCSIGELITAERAGFPAARLNLHGCGKTNDELEAAAAGRVGTIIVDNLDELRRLGERARSARPLDVVLRMNTGIEAHTHEFMRTGGSKTKFGMPAEALPKAADVLASASALRYRGLHAHIGSQIYQAQAFEANSSELLALTARAAALGMHGDRLIAGGGFGISMSPDDGERIDIPATIDAMANAVRANAARMRMPAPQIGLEPGRALIGRAGTSLYRVMAAKEQFGTPYVVVDGGIADNPRPALYNAYHHPLLASRKGEIERETVVCGRSCENDRIVTAPLPRDVSAGDVLAVCITGAYTFSMASNYNRFARPAVVAVDGTTHTLLARRETIEHVLRNDCDA